VTLGTDRVVQCKAATQDQPGAHARVACLSQRAATVGGLLAALETLPADSLPNGPGAVTLIPNVSSCSNGRPYTMPSHPPKLLTQAIQLEAEIERAKVMSRFGHYEEAIRDVSAALVEAKRLGIRGVVARAHFTLAAIAKERGNRDLARAGFEQAAELAEESGNDALRADALSGQMVLANDETALAALARRAEAVVIRTDDPAMLARFLSRRGVAKLKRGFGAEGVDDLENARSMQLSLDGEDTVAIARIDGNLSAGLAMVGRIEESVERRRHAVELSRIHNGTEHPAYARHLGSLGQQVDEKEGAEMLREALSVFRKNFGEAHPDTVQALSNLCVVEGKFQSPDAVTHCTEAVAAADLLHGPNAPEVAWPLTALGLELLNLDRFAEAEVALKRGLRVAADPPRYPNEVADLQYYLGVSLAKQDIQLPKALSLIRAAREVWGESPVRQALVPELDQLVEKLELAIQEK
ncbi:MAG: tetratricopeptide repeat protein, partial [Kofleriaceae bacterium]|nr:tetratricopeptide repeat protein [Kofleriaceae bacterium]